ncbi:putative bifunctional diguanylate cyclase/phosphodiesterase [Pseudohaliea rubra]|uniref:Diguanylate cyclase/phosphodiesterase (GGDEF & EAL domain protein) with PAS/PAC sensor(S) n=1 Tax=Pseudohaliea rubra DSM 19751 TaxID=1265313 RepID=A0A095X1M1_9GAMM|nr:EAL domain-containing protein [Pseudohaliea rubra]KGE04764.1 diguanylate cyclase/phosphodiesterase (GGDEF & EAL domain protein) with PAS/PAC sensor(s) [Pseudohaliea rubra DSM 19751]
MTPASAQPKAKILVSDDDMNVRLLTRQCLEAEGMTVVEAADGQQALDAFLRERPDLIFLDVEMPGLSGLEVCRRIREMPQGENIPIMIVTGSDDRKSIDEGFEAGATQYKTKPVNWSLLGRDVQYMLRASNALNSLKRQEDRLRYLAYYDPLTNLPNRRSFNEQLTRILKRAQRLDHSAALLFIDLDNFKRINDSIGHGRGDRLLVEIAKRLARELREDDAINYLSDSNAGAVDERDRNTEIARLGGDEFTVVLSDVRDMRDVESVAQRIIQTLSEPISLHSHNPVVTPSIGIAMYPQDGLDADSLVRNADTAMYAAKADGRACFRFYNEAMNARSVEQLKLEEDLREAMREGQLELRYQPQVDTTTGRVVSLEALVRWKHPVRGLISPGDFIPVAERTGQIIELGEWVLSEVARHCTFWETLGLDDFRVCVNISPLQFNQPDLVERVRYFLEHSGLRPSRLELELTESAIMTDAKTNIDKLRQLNELGLDLAVDDFGTGYSSLSYLKRFPIRTLKIDQSFVADMSSHDGVAIVDAIIVLAKTLNLRSIAEGIETRDQLRHLAAQHCDLLQGFFFARPLYPEDVPDALRHVYAQDIADALRD